MPDKDANDLRPLIGLYIGSAFSLWRAVFLYHDKEGWDHNLTDAEAFFIKLIKDNSMVYGDESRWRAWFFGYWTNNARYRIQRMTGKVDALEDTLREVDLWDYIFRYRSDVKASVVWNKIYCALEYAVNLLRKQLEMAG